MENVKREGRRGGGEGFGYHKGRKARGREEGWSRGRTTWRVKKTQRKKRGW